ncbi:hypothetical protein [Pseudovibrio sp. SPO723]|uniref:hypothetical protein n=1 Tax=Nesiotobacter zosterae TaxID=392721 RepID=UPI0029C4F3CB|nr:hypothetical protein [Pseudovibrio sp. SPO723]MDX5595268.1 hypothetical protein [Pseudovibrio sp. SPO723]
MAALNRSSVAKACLVGGIGCGHDPGIVVGVLAENTRRRPGGGSLFGTGGPAGWLAGKQQLCWIESAEAPLV